MNELKAFLKHNWKKIFSIVPLAAILLGSLLYVNSSRQFVLWTFVYFFLGFPALFLYAGKSELVHSDIVVGILSLCTLYGTMSAISIPRIHQDESIQDIARAYLHYNCNIEVNIRKLPVVTSTQQGFLPPLNFETIYLKPRLDVLSEVLQKDPVEVMKSMYTYDLANSFIDRMRELDAYSRTCSDTACQENTNVEINKLAGALREIVAMAGICKHATTSTFVN